MYPDHRSSARDLAQNTVEILSESSTREMVAPLGASIADTTSLDVSWARIFGRLFSVSRAETRILSRRRRRAARLILFVSSFPCGAFPQTCRVFEA